MGVEERYKKRKEEEKTKTLYNGVENRYLYKNAEAIGKEISDRINTWITNNNNYISNAQNRFSGENTTFRTDASDWLTTVQTQRENFRKEAEGIKSVLTTYKDIFGEEYVNSVFEALDGNLKMQDSVIDTSTKDVEYWKQWGSEDEYNSWYQYRQEMDSVLKAEDFNEYFSAGEAKAVREKFWKGVENNVAYLRDPANLELYESSANSANGASLGTVENTLLDQLDYKAAKYMTDEEYKVYNYYVGKGDAEKADSYLKSLEETLTRRQAGELVSDIKGNALKEAFFAVESGLDQFWSGIGNIDNLIMGTEADTPSATQMASPEIREGIDGIGGVAYDLAQTTANMFPSILVGAVTGGVGGALTMGSSALGNAYAEMRTLGYDEWQSRGYAVLVGASETTLQYALGGISKLGGKVTGNVIGKVISSIDNAFARTAIQLGGNMLSEGLEEAVQEVLDPVFKMLATGEDFEGVDLESVIYSGLLGALSAGLLEGAPTIVGAVNNNSAINTEAKEIYGNGAELVSEALEIDPANAYAQKMQRKLDGGKDLSGGQINRLVEQNESAMAKNDISAITSAAESRLTELGERGDVKAIAAALTKQAQGERLTFTEREIIRSSTFGYRVANELNTENIKSGEYSSSWAEKIGTDRINAEEYGRLIQSMEAEDAAESTNIPISNEQKTAVDVGYTAETPENIAVTNTDEVEATPVTENTAAEKSATEAKKTASVEVLDAEESSVTLDSASKKYGAQAGAMVATYTEGQDVEKFDAAYQAAYDMGKSGVNLSYARTSKATAYLTERQRELAHAAGVDASTARAVAQDAENKAKINGKTGRKKGVVKGEGVSIGDLKASFNDTQNTAYKLLSTYAEATSVDIVLYKSETNADGQFEGAQGKFKWSEDTIYIDINAGLANIKDVNELAKYTMMRTFAHEFTHFIEKWNPIWYNEFRKVVFDTLTERGENVEDLIETKMSQSEGMTYDEASREVVAEAMTDILPDANFVEKLANEHKNIFQKLLEKLRDFVADLKAYFNALGHNSSREANALKEQVGEGVKYLENIVKLFDKVAMDAVENYQMTVAVEEATVSKAEKVEKNVKAEKTLFEKYNEVKQKYPNNIVLYRVGDFFEVLGEDAAFVAKWTGATMVSRNDPNAGRVAMVGFPFHLLEKYVEKIRTHQDVTLVQEEGGVIKEYPMSPLESAKKQTTVDKLSKTVAPKPADVAPKVDNTEIEEREKAYKKKFSQWLKKGGRQYVLHYGGASFLSDGGLAIKATEDEIGWARLEFSGVINEADLPKQTADVLDNATTLVTEAPLEGGLGNDSVYVFNVDGKNQVYSKKLLSKLDGNTFYMGDFMKGYKLIKAVDTEGNVAGFLLPMKAVTEITNTKPSKLKSFSSKMQANNNERASFIERAANKNTVTASETAKAGTASEKLATKLLEGYINEKNIKEGGKALTSKELYALADEAFGGTQAEGAYNRKDAYDAMELAVNKFLLTEAARSHRTFNGTAKSAVTAVEFMQDMLELLPTQNVRTQEMEDFQQFSTPPNIAYLAAWVANVRSNDFVLEPSAGIGGLAVFAKAWGAEVAVNELSKRRLEVLRSMGFDHLFNENAEHIDDILPDSISPSVVIMNPPFSSTAGRTANNKTSNAEKHIDQALARLRDGGRLVAVLGKSMNNNDYYKYWDKLRKSVSIRANLSIDGDNYKKYGTTWGVQIVVIDKTGPQVGETVTGRFTDLAEVPKVLEGIRNDRSNVEANRLASRNDGIGKSVSDGGNRQSDTGHERSSKRTSRSATDSQRTENRKSADGNEGAGNRADGKGVTENSSPQTERQDGGADREVRRTDTRNGDSTTESSISYRHQPEQSLSGLSDSEQVNDDGVYATFVAPAIPVTGGKKHPAVLVESAAMAAVSMPKATYKVKLPANVIKNNLSDAQLVTVTYAGQAHEQKLADGRRKGFFVGDGTGVGKGRQIAGIILDNFMQGRNKAVWISKNNDLYGDAIRDWTATTGRSKDEVINHNKIKSKDKISIKEGILYSTYDTLKSEKGGNRLEQIVEWLGEDFDGVIAFDEAHNMGNLFGKKGKFGKSKGSEKARAGVELQRRLPNARIVYVSATAATEVDNLAYAERIGLWGQGTAFTNAQDFISKIGSSGLAAMELVIRDMKAMGTYVARSISYNGVNYDTVEHSLDPMQTEIYNTMSRAWQKTMSNVQSALETTGGKYNGTERQRALGNFYSGMQRFYNQVLTSMSMPSVIADMRRELDEGHSCVLQIVNTNEAQQNKQLAEAKANGESLDNLDLTPREALIGYLMNSFPIQMFEEYTDEDGNLRSRPVIDSAGNPVQSKEAIRQRDMLVREVNQMSIPDGPLEMLFDAFGPDMVAENTGRSRRVVPRKKADGTISRVEERRTLNHRTADVQAFQDGKKRILVFSDAGGTGKSYHADRTEKNQQLRIHYVLQPGWVASNAVQGFGRTHRSNEASAPIYKLVTTNIKGQKRFTSTIARRLDQLGALTKGQRDTGSGMFGAKDNLETDLAKDSLREFYRRLGKNQIEGVDGMKALDRLGLKEKFTDEYGGFKLNDNISRDISTFLNRILALEVDEQNIVFDSFISIYEMELEAAIQSGTLDTGMENVKADKIEVVDDKVIRKDDNTGSETHYIQAKTYTKPKVVTAVEEISKKRSGFVGIYKTDTDAIKAVFRIADKTTEWGSVQKQYRLIGPNLGAKTTVWGENTLTARATEIDKAEWQKEWDTEVAKVPEYNEDTLHMLTGALLPIWNSLPQEGNTKVKRLITDKGDAYLGRVIDKDLIDGVLGRFSIDRTKEVFTAQQVMDKAIDSGVRFYLTNNRTEIYRSKVSGEWRLEIYQPYNAWYLTKTYPGIMQERIQYRDRYFIPVGEKGIAILEKMLADNPVRSTADYTVQEQSRAYLKDNYSTEGVHWGVEQGIITNKEARIIWESIAKIEKLGYNSYPKTMYGDSFIESDNFLMVVDTDYHNPQVKTIYKFNDTYETNMAMVKELIINAKGDQTGNREALRFIEDNFGSGYVTEYNRYESNAWKNGRREGANSGTHNSEAPIREWRFDEQEQQRTNTLTDREILRMAADALQAAELTEAERDALQIFKNRVSKLETLQDDRAEQGRLYKEQQFGAKVDRTAAEATLNRMRVLDEQIKTATADVLSIDDKKVLGDVLKKARKVVEADQRAHDAELVKRWRDRTRNAAAIRKYRERIQKDVGELTNWVMKPNNKDIVKHIPDALKNSVIPFLTSIDFTSNRQLRGGEATKADAEFVKRLNGLNAALKNNIDISGMYSGYNDLPPNFMDKLQSFIDTVNAIISKHSGEFVINQMTSAELKELSDVVRVIKAYITQFNKFHANAMYSHVWEAGDNSIETLSAMASDNGKSDKVSNFVFWQQIRPAFAFERFGEGGKAIYDGLRRGQAQLAFNTQKIVEFTEKAYTDKEVKAWEKEIKTIKISAGTVKMRVSDMMSFYELSKQPDSLRHMLGEGMRVATYTLDGKKISDNGHALTEKDIADIINELTPRQKEVADAMQKFMAEQGGAWGNYVSVARFGEELFTNKQYFPINSDGRHLQSTADENPSAASLYALLNMSFTKSRNELANNRIIVYSIFDVFANHMASMAQYNAMALPVLDAIKWFNYNQKTEDADGNRYVKDGVREQMDRVYGVPEETRPGSGRQGYAQSFVLNILKAFNGTEAQGVPTDTIGMNATRRYNMAQVAYNFRVVVQQPLAITRAALLVDYKSIAKGIKLKPSAIKQNIKEMRKYSGIAAWKSLGFYDVNISRGLTETIKHSSTLAQNIGEFGMKGAELADTLTWAGIWSACKEEVRRKQGLTPKSEVFYEAVTKLFEDVIYKTQVVDSILTKNEYMRSKGFWARWSSSFMSEPTTTASMLIDSVDKFNADMKRGMTRSQAWEKNKRKIGRTMYVYGVSAVMLAAVQAVADALRDDDDYETFIEKWLEAFGANLLDEAVPINKLPYANQAWEVFKEWLGSGFEFDIYGQLANLPYTDIAENFIKGTEILRDLIMKEDTNYTYYGGIYKLLQAASGMFGLPMATATREAITAWNNIVGAMAPSLKVKTYDSGEQNDIKYAYQDGYLTFDEAVGELMEQGLVDNEDEAYFTVSGWEVGDEYSRYDKVYDAVRNGGSITEAMAELTSHGYTEKDVISRIKSKVGEWYRGGEVSKDQTVRMLETYTDMSSEEITKQVNQWSSKVVTGIEYDDIGDEYLEGNITANRAKEMYMRYGGMTSEEAAEKVTVLEFVKEHPSLEGISASAVLSYKEHCEGQGVDAEIFYDVWQYNSSVTADVDRNGNTISGSKKAKVLEYIHTLDLSRKQKDSLYFAFGWAKSTISDAPWR